MKTEVSEAALKAGLPVTITGITLFGITLNEWVYLLTIVYLLLQIVVLIKDKIFGKKIDAGTPKDNAGQRESTDSDRRV